VQNLVKEQPVDAAPHTAQPERRRVPELLDGEDAGAVQALLHARADPVDLLQFEAEQNLGQVLLRDDDQPVRLLQIGADLAEKDVRRDADRAGEALANDADADLASPTDGEQESGIRIYPPGPRLGCLREKAREKDYQNGVRTISGIPGTLG
jgi:hypothetical protein